MRGLQGVAMNAYVMDDVDRRLLDIIQTNFPLSPRPYAELGQQTGISEEEALAYDDTLPPMERERKGTDEQTLGKNPGCRGCGSSGWGIA